MYMLQEHVPFKYGPGAFYLENSFRLVMVQVHIILMGLVMVQDHMVLDKSRPNRQKAGQTDIH